MSNSRIKVHLACEARESDKPYSRADYARLRHYATRDKNDRFKLTENAHEAQIIIFVGSSEPNFGDIRRSKLYKKYRSKCVVSYAGDKLIPLLPGIYPSIENRMTSRDSSRQSSCYLRVTDNTALENLEPISNAKYLYSFKGNCKNHEIRAELLKLSHPRAVLADTSTQNRGQTDSNNTDFVGLIEKSKFILCPRGIGTSSWRLFETMRAGRVPVIVSDDWVEPPNINWNRCSIRVAEEKVGEISEILESREMQAPTLAANARAEWVRHYSQENLFNTIAEQALEAINAYQKNRHISFKLYSFYFLPFFFRHWLLGPIKSALIGRRR